MTPAMALLAGMPLIFAAGLCLGFLLAARALASLPSHSPKTDTNRH